MKILKSNLAIKITAVFLMLIFGIAFLFSVFCISEMRYDYNQHRLFTESGAYEYVMRNYASTAYNNYAVSKTVYNELKENNTNCYIHITDRDDIIVYSNYDTKAINTDGLTEYISPQYIYYNNAMRELYNVHIFLKDITVQDSIYFAREIFLLRYALIAFAVGTVLLVIALGIFLLIVAGHRKDTDEIIPSFIDRIPIEALFFICVMIVIAMLFIYNELYYLEILILIVAIIFYFIAVTFIMSVAVRIKLRTFWKNSIIYYVLRFCLNIIRALPLIWKSALIIVAFLFVNFFCFVVGAFPLNVLLVFVALGYVAYFLIALSKLKSGTKKIASGDLNYKIDTANLPFLFDLREISNDLNNISAGMSKAVNERIKSERMKGELITNVSHDIKTPLTSIINYVDLLKKEELNNDTATEYIEILDRQSSKLKKLTDDLIDASKASTGNVSVNITELDIIELLDQSIGEYSEKFRTVGITPVMSLNGIETLLIQSDGRLLWRVFDNLLNNIYKYTLPNTRIYIDVTTSNDSVTINLKNISRDPLNVSSDELMERFIRGDSSRTTEGSGLGLSISRGLVEILGGSLNVSIDGDLFKASITLRNEGTRF
jgi:Signal transduction histidine kinase